MADFSADSESIIRIDRHKVLEDDTNILPIASIKGRILVGGYLIGKDHYCNKIVGITTRGKVIEGVLIDRLLSTDVRFTGQDRLEEEYCIILEHPHIKAGGKDFIQTFRFSKERPIIKQFKIVKSN